MLNSWYNKFQKLSQNYQEEVKNLIKKNQEPTKISNHIIYNCTGRYLEILKIDKNKSRSEISNIIDYKDLIIDTIPNGIFFSIVRIINIIYSFKILKKIKFTYLGKTYEIDYFQKIKKQSSKSFKNSQEEKSIKISFTDESEILQDSIKLDLVNSKLHKVDYSKNLIKHQKKNMLNSEEDLNFFIMYSFIFSSVIIEKLRRHIYLYSPLTFTNKFNQKIFLILKAKHMSNLLIFAEPEEIIGIPFEYFDGEICFELNGNISNSFKIFDLLYFNPKYNSNKYIYSNYNNTIDIKFENQYLCMFLNEEFLNNKFTSSEISSKIDINVFKTMKNYIISFPYCIRNLMPFDILIKIKNHNPDVLTNKIKEISKGSNNIKKNINLKETNPSIKDKNENFIQMELCKNQDFEKETINNINNIHLEEGEYIIKKSEKVFITCVSPSQNLEAEISFLDKFFKTKGYTILFKIENSLKNPKEKFQNNHIIQISDPHGNIIDIFSTFSDDSLRTLHLYSAGVLVNETGLCDLNFYYNSESKNLNKEKKYFYKKNEKSNIYLVDPNKKLIIQYKSMKSKPINLKIIGIDNVIELQDKEGNKIEFVFVSKLSLLTKELSYYANIYTLYPKFIFLNKLDFDLYVSLDDIKGIKLRQSSIIAGSSPKKNIVNDKLISDRNSILNTKIVEILRVKEKIPFYFFNKGSNNFVCFLPIEKNFKLTQENKELNDVIHEEEYVSSNKNINEKDYQENNKNIYSPEIFINEQKSNFIEKGQYSKNKSDSNEINDIQKCLKTKENNCNNNLNDFNKENNSKKKLNSNENIENNNIKNISWNWSFPVNLNQDKFFPFQLFSIDKQKRMLINLEKKIEGFTTFVILTQVNNDNYQIKIENNSKIFGIILRQQKFEEYFVEVNTEKTEYFSWVDIQKPKIIDLIIFKKIFKPKSNTINNSIDVPISITKSKILNFNEHNSNILNLDQNIQENIIQKNLYFKENEINREKINNYFIPKLGLSDKINMIESMSFKLLEKEIIELNPELNKNLTGIEKDQIISDPHIKKSNKTLDFKNPQDTLLHFGKIHCNNQEKNTNYPFHKSLYLENVETQEEYIVEIKIEKNGLKKVIKIKDYNENENSENNLTTKFTEDIDNPQNNKLISNNFSKDIRKQKGDTYSNKFLENLIEFEKEINNTQDSPDIKFKRPKVLELKQKKLVDSYSKLNEKIPSNNEEKNNKNIEFKYSELEVDEKENKIIKEKNESKSEKTNEVEKSNSYSITIPYLGISIIGDNKNINYSNIKYERNELFYMSFKRVEILYNYNENISEYYQVKIGDIKLDNQFSDFAIFPNILVSNKNFEEASIKSSTSKHKLYAGSILLPDKPEQTRKEIENHDKNAKITENIEENIINNKPNIENKDLFKLIISIELEKKNEEVIKHIKNIEYDLSPFYLNIDTSVISKIIEFSDNLTIELETSVLPVDQIFWKEEKEIQQKSNKINKNMQSAKSILDYETKIRRTLNSQNNDTIDTNPFKKSNMNELYNDTIKQKIDNNHQNEINIKNKEQIIDNFIREEMNNNIENKNPKSNKFSSNNVNIRNSCNSVNSYFNYNKSETLNYYRNHASFPTDLSDDKSSNKSNTRRKIIDDYIQPFWEMALSLEKAGSDKYLIERLLLSKIEINFSFISQGDAKEVFKRLLSANPIITSLLSSLTNVENVKLILKGSLLENVFGNTNEIINNAIYNYKQSALSQILKILGSIEIFGNPVNLMNSLGTGFKDFIEKPVEGLKTNVVSGAIGVAEGGLSLVKHTVKGTFSTTGKITSGISKGFLYLTQDDEYIKKQQIRKIIHKPKNFVEGLGYGLSYMVGGIYYGFRDVIMKPIQGAKKEKWKGLGKGVLKGFAGVIIKPISGVLDLVSQTSEGIKNTLIRELDDNRERWPRMFFGKFKFVIF